MKNKKPIFLLIKIILVILLRDIVISEKVSLIQSYCQMRKKAIMRKKFHSNKRSIRQKSYL